MPKYVLVTDFKKHKFGRYLHLKQSKDLLVRNNVPELCSSIKSKVEIKASNIESRIKIWKVMGNTHVGGTD